MNLMRALISFSLALTLAAQEADLSVIHLIKAEAFKRGDVIKHLAALTDDNGPRLTASPGFNKAAEWTLTRLREWGLANPHLETWGPFGRSWALKRFSAQMTLPAYSPLIGFPLPWSGQTRGAIHGSPVLVPVKDADMRAFRSDLDRIRKEYAGKLKGSIVMTTPVRDAKLQLQAAARRLSDAELLQQALSPDPVLPGQFDYSRLALPEESELRVPFMMSAPPAFAEALRDRRRDLRLELHEFLRREGAVAVLSTDTRGDGGTVFGESVGWWQARYPVALPVIALTPEHYNRIARLLGRKIPVSLELEVQAEMSESDVNPSNVVAEIPGGAKRDELVLVGAHLDSWTGGTGATDNASGSAVALEAVRILKTLGLKLDRTIRLVLWSGEEQGLLGSKAYVKEHFGDPATMQLKPAHQQVSAYFNLDNGSGKIRGVYLQGNDAARPLFERWLAPFRDLGVTTISLRNTGGTDHLSFDAVGLPGFQFIQDPLEYASRTHHSNIDVFDHAQAPDLMQAAAVMASVLYHAANLPAKMPRKPVPEPAPKWTPAPDTPSGAPGTN